MRPRADASPPGAATPWTSSPFTTTAVVTVSDRSSGGSPSRAAGLGSVPPTSPHPSGAGARRIGYGVTFHLGVSAVFEQNSGLRSSEKASGTVQTPHNSPIQAVKAQKVRRIRSGKWKMPVGCPSPKAYSTPYSPPLAPQGEAAQRLSKSAQLRRYVIPAGCRKQA
jgi:hypothetical protein